MKKKLILILVIIFVICLVSCGNQATVNNNTKDNTQNIESTESPNISSTNQASDANKSNTDWNPNHGIANVVSEHDADDNTEEYVYINSNEGWKAYSEPIGAGQKHTILYKTTDSGVHWDKIIDSTDTSSTMPGGDILFINSKVGWIISNFPMKGTLRLYKTNDGGVTWEIQDISSSSEYSTITFNANLPVFFSKNDGIIFVSCIDTVSNKDIDPVAFITHDGGENWSIISLDENDKTFSWNIKKQDNTISEFQVIYNNEVWNSEDAINWTKIKNK